jgi:DNA-binding SARP family transcriptional activator
MVKQAGQQVVIPRRNVRGVLYYLAAQSQPVSRDHLCLLFWLDLPEANARRNLTRLLTHLRMALPDPSILVTDENFVSLDPAWIWCDVFEFKRQSTPGQKTAEELEEAVQLYRASFLVGFDLPDCLEFEHWISRERAALESLYLENLIQLMGLSAARQDYAKAIECAQRYLETDELTEEVHRRLITYYALAGMRTKALRQYETCVFVLEQQLGADPLPETRAIYQAVLEERLPVIQPERVEEVQPAWSQGLRLDFPMVGRADPLNALEASFQKIGVGQNSVILISGEPGIGKSRLLHDFMKQCWGNCLVLYGAGQRGEQTVSYHPIVEALRMQLASVPLSVPPYWLAEVSRLLPELAKLYTHLPRPLSLKGEEARIRLFEALCQCLSALQAGSRPVLLCLDDLHWFDPTSLSWMVYLARQFLSKNSRLLVVGTYRSEDIARVKELRDGLARQGLLREIKLEGLTSADILELLQSLFGKQADQESFAARLREATGGNPLFLLEMLRALTETVKNSGGLSHYADLPLPEGVREAIDQRIDRLSPKARQVLEAGAVIGPAFDLQVVRMTAGRTELEAETGLAELVRRQIILEDKQGYRFCHDLVYRATTAGISPMRLQLLHSRAAKALEKIQPDSITALAYHFETAGDLKKAFLYYRRSARQAEGLFAWREAAAHYRCMYRILDEMDPDCSLPDCLSQRSDILKELARLNQYQNRLSERDANLEQLESLVPHSRDPKFELKALVLRTYYLHQDGQYGEAASLAEKGLALADKVCDDPIRCRLLAQLGFSLQFLGQPYQALAALEQAQAIADVQGDIEMRGQILSRMGFIYNLFSRYRQALDCQLESSACYMQINEPYTAARNLPQIGLLHNNLSQYDQAWQALSEILALARKAGVQSDEAHALMGMGGYGLCRGEYFLALGCFQQALSGLENTRAQNLIASTQASMGMVFYHLGNLTEAHASLERGLQTARKVGHRMRIAQALVQLSLVEIAQSSFPAAREHVVEGISLARETYSKEDLTAGLTVQARLERLEGKFLQSQSLAAEAIAETQDLDLRSVEVWARTETGLAALAAGELELAQAMVQQAVEMSGSVHQRWLGREEVYLANAQIARRLGQIEAAEEILRQAQEIIQTKATAIPDPAMRQGYLAKFSLHTFIL